MKIPVSKIVAVITYAEGLCASVLVDRVIKRVRRRDDESKLEQVVFDIGAHALSVAASAYFIDKATRLIFTKDECIKFPPKKSLDKDSSKNDLDSSKRRFQLAKYIHGLINSYGDAVYSGVESLRENIDGHIYDSAEYLINGHPVSKYIDWQEFIEVLNEYHQLMCNQNADWNFENTCNEVKKIIQNYWDFLEANKKDE